MNDQDEMEVLRNKLEKLIATTENLIDCEVVSLSQELDKLISKYLVGLETQQHNFESEVLVITEHEIIT